VQLVVADVQVKPPGDEVAV
jgi:hypothetical protein